MHVVRISRRGLVVITHLNEGGGSAVRQEKSQSCEYKQAHRNTVTSETYNSETDIMYEYILTSPEDFRDRMTGDKFVWSWRSLPDVKTYVTLLLLFKSSGAE